MNPGSQDFYEKTEGRKSRETVPLRCTEVWKTTFNQAK
jgi:hypothetical protein